MIEFEVSKAFSLSPDAVWDVVREVKDYTKYWHGTRDLDVTQVSEGVFEGVARLAFPAKVKVKVTVSDAERRLTVEYLEGVMRGSHTVEVLDREIRSHWRVNLSPWLKPFEGRVKGHFMSGVNNALERVIEEAEKRIEGSLER